MRALSVVGFIRGRWIHSRASVLWIVGFNRSRWVLSRAAWVSLASSWFFGFARARPGSRWVHPGLLSSLQRILGDFVFIRCCWVRLAHPGGSWVNPWLLGSRKRVLVVIGFILCRWVKSRIPFSSFGSYGVVGLIRKRHGCR